VGLIGKQLRRPTGKLLSPNSKPKLTRTSAQSKADDTDIVLKDTSQTGVRGQGDIGKTEGSGVKTGRATRN
jgi:hypothetical protein